MATATNSTENTLALTGALAAAILFLLYPTWRAVVFRRNKKDPYEIEPCPNPGCIRCRKYAEVCDMSRRRLPWVKSAMKQLYHKQDIDLELSRVIEAVKRGRAWSGHRHHPPGPSPSQGQYPTVFLVGELLAQPLVTAMHKISCQKMEQHKDTILIEYLSSQKEGLWAENNVIGKWEVLHFLNQGIWNEENMALCPQTTKLVKSLFVLDGCIFGNAFISVLQPGSTIEPHCGPTNVRHRLHLALQIPQEEGDGCRLQVLHESLGWREGEAFVFDDSLTHSAVYTSAASAPRVVLIVDLWHPDLSQMERETIKELFPAVR